MEELTDPSIAGFDAITKIKRPKRNPKSRKRQTSFFIFIFWTFLSVVTSIGINFLIFEPDPSDNFLVRYILQINDCPTDAKLADLGDRLKQCSESNNILRETNGNSSQAEQEDDRNLEIDLAPAIHIPGLTTCKAAFEEWREYFASYDSRGPCPDDWPLAQSLIFTKGCVNLPLRECFTRSPPRYVPPIPRSQALWRDPDRRNIRWSNYECKHFVCLRKRKRGDCRECFNWTIESQRWEYVENSNWDLSQVLTLKKGTIRLALDVAGGSGSFAAKLYQHNISCVTTGMNTGAPFLETIALRGLIGLHVPMNARLPFFDGTVDLVHSQHALQMLPQEEFEYALFDWDRVLRPGGVIWIEKLSFTEEAELKRYIKVVELLKYKQHSWVKWHRNGLHKFSAVIEKPLPWR